MKHSELIERLRELIPDGDGYNDEFAHTLEAAIAELQRKDEVIERINEARQDAALRAVLIHDSIDEEIRQLCEAYGYGAVIDSAARQWALQDPYGAFFVGGCLLMEELPFPPEETRDNREAK